MFLSGFAKVYSEKTSTDSRFDFLQSECYILPWFFAARRPRMTKEKCGLSGQEKPGRVLIKILKIRIMKIGWNCGVNTVSIFNGM